MTAEKAVNGVEEGPSAAEDAEGEEDEEGEDGVYAIESIIEHRRGKAVANWEYRIRWEGYGPEDDTWEPHQQIQETAQEAIDAYWEKKGGFSPYDAGTARKRKRTSSPAQASAKARATPTRQLDTTWKAPLELSSWEDEAVVDTVEQDKHGNLLWVLTWPREGRTTRHRAELVYSKMPLGAIKFFEANLVFRQVDSRDH